ncbi:uncharacterized protein LOC130429788 [Triplophysa dalaica]|uniref:uncharacterized protein LOC130429788 n=1 Tax=Triplophysa dalaica TaxID=1582913 RepID=UPI0024DF9130|nr:uncharacterized protein LOC130429788 [Triplophysa dalaica]
MTLPDKQRSTSALLISVSLKSDNSKNDGPNFSEKTPSDIKSHRWQETLINIGSEITRWKTLKEQKGIKSDEELTTFLLERIQFETSDADLHTSEDDISRIFQGLDNKIAVFFKNELERFKKILKNENTQYYVKDFKENKNNIRETALDVTIHFLRSMKQDELADTLEDELIYTCQLKSDLEKKYQCVFEGIAKQGDSTLLNKIYTDLFITQGGGEQVNTEHEIRQIEVVSRHLESPDIEINFKDLFKPHEQTQTIRTVITKGVAAIGKSVSVQKFVLDWAEGKENQDISFIFPLPFREMNLKEKSEVSLKDLLCEFFPEIKGLDLTRKNKKILFILDGLDECRLPLKFDGNEIWSDFTSPAPLDVLLTNLIKGNLLPHAHIWITTRSAAAGKIPPECIDRVTEVRGFNDEQKKEYFRKRFTDQNMADTIIDHVKKSKSLFIMCHIPVFCWISATVLQNILEKKSKDQTDDTQESNTDDTPRTLTQMYIHFLRFQIQQSRRKYDGEYSPDISWDIDSIYSLGKLAFEQLEKSNLIFYESDLEECGIDVTKASVYSGMCTQIFKQETGIIYGTVYCFVHLSIQEFVAALYAHLFLDKNKKNVFVQEHMESEAQNETLTGLLKTAVDKALESDNGHLDLFLRFLLGLSLESNRPLLRGLLSQEESNKQNNTEIVEYIKQKFEDSLCPERSINLFYCLNELNDQTLVQEIQKHLSEGSLSSSDLSPAQWSALAFVLLTSDEELEEFELQKYKKSDECLDRLSPVIKSSKRALERSASSGLTSVSLKSDRSKHDPPTFSEKTPSVTESFVSHRSASPVFSSVSLKSDNSKCGVPNFSEKTTSDVKSERWQETLINIGSEITRWKTLKEQRGIKSDEELTTFLLDRIQFETSTAELQHFKDDFSRIFQGLEKKIAVFFKNELERFKKILKNENTQHYVKDFKENKNNIMETALDVTIHFLRSMKQDELADTLEDELIYTCQLKSDLEKKYQCVFEGIAKQGDFTLLNKIYTDLFITQGGGEQVNTEHEIRQIEVVSRHLESPDIQINFKDLFKPHEQTQIIRTVLTKGVADIGKSVSVQKFVLDWAEGKENQDISFIFPLPFREMNLKEKAEVSLKDLLCEFFPEIKGLDLTRKNKKILFILDGLDECRLPLKFDGNEIWSDITSPAPLDVLLTNLIKGNLLPHAHIWITTRPAAAGKIPSECINRVTEVRGFNDEQKKEYFRKRFTDQNMADTIIDHVKKSKSLFMMCHIPVFCWISATVLQNILEKKSKDQTDDTQESNTDDTPRTLTQMYIHFFRFQIQQSRRKYDGEYSPDISWDMDSIYSLGKLAFEQLEKNNLIFYESDLEDCGIDVSKASVYSGMCTQIFKQETGIILGTVYCFVHLSIQEFIAALYAHLFLDKNKKNVFVQEHMESVTQYETLTGLLKTAVDKALESDNGHLDLFLRFLLGLSLESNRPLLQGLLSQEESNKQNNTEIVEYIKQKFEDSLCPERSINLFYCLNELNDQTLVQEIQKHLSEGSLSSSDLSPAQWSALAFVLLTSDEELEEFELQKYKKSDECLDRLSPVIKSSKRALERSSLSVSVKSDRSKDDGPSFSEKTPSVTKRSTSALFRSVSLKSDESKGDGPNFSEKTPSDIKSIQCETSAAELQHFKDDFSRIFQGLENNIVVFFKNELKRFKNILKNENTQHYVKDFQENKNNIRETALEVTIHFLRSMKQDELADTLEDELIYTCQLKSDLEKKYQCVFEGIAKQGDSTLLNKIYTDLYITQGGGEQVNTEHEIRQIEVVSRRLESPDIQINFKDLFKPHEQTQTIRTVLTKGVAGIGKSVSVQKFVLDWAEGKENQDISFIFPLPFREMNLKEKAEVSLKDLLHEFFPEIKGLELTRKNKKVLFILDGLDECRLPLKFDGNEIWSDITSPAPLDVLLTNLIKGNLLPHAHIWITTRPAAAGKIPPECIDRVTEVRGFNDEQKKEYFRKRFTDQNMADTIIDHVKKSKSLFIMCHIPVFCWISATVLQNILKKKSKDQTDDTQESNTDDTPRTLTQMYTHFFRFQIQQSRRKYDGEHSPDISWDMDSIYSLGKLAFEQLEKTNLIFYESDLKECGIDVSKASVYSGMCTQIFREEKGIIHGTVYCFVHLSIQEFIAALYAHLFLDKNKKNVFVEVHMESEAQNETLTGFLKTAVDKALESDNGHLDLFLRFLLGLSLESNRPLLQGLLSQEESNKQNNTEIVQYIKKKFEDSLCSERSINLFYCLNELNDQTLVQEIQKHLSEGRLSSFDLSPAQWSALTFVLLTSEEELKDFELQKYKKSDECLVRLSPVVKSSKRALLNDCNLTDKSCSALSRVLSSDNSLEELNMSNNNLQDSGVRLLCDGLKNTKCELLKLR